MGIENKEQSLTNQYLYLSEQMRDLNHKADLQLVKTAYRFDKWINSQNLIWEDKKVLPSGRETTKGMEYIFCNPYYADAQHVLLRVRKYPSPYRDSSCGLIFIDRYDASNEDQEIQNLYAIRYIYPDWFKWRSGGRRKKYSIAKSLEIVQNGFSFLSIDRIDDSDIYSEPTFRDTVIGWIPDRPPYLQRVWRNGNMYDGGNIGILEIGELLVGILEKSKIVGKRYSNEELTRSSIKPI